MAFRDKFNGIVQNSQLDIHETGCCACCISSAVVTNNSSAVLTRQCMLHVFNHNHPCFVICTWKCMRSWGEDHKLVENTDLYDIDGFVRASLVYGGIVVGIE